MEIRVFDVEHGACALVTDCLRGRLLIDCGHNATSNWYPGSGLNMLGVTSIHSLFVTNYDEDHVSGIENLFQHVSVPRIFRNMSVTPAKIRELKSEDGMGPGIDFLVGTSARWLKNGTIGVSENGLSDVEVQTFCNTPAQFEDENNLSMAVFIRSEGIGFMFTGDLEKPGWTEILKEPAMREALSKTDVFFASHHGRESGCSDLVFEYCHPTFVVISDKKKGFQTQETTQWYYDRCRGGYVTWSSNPRRVLTTRNDGSLRFDVSMGKFTVSKF